METNKKLVEVLNDLLQINNDRVNGYLKAAGDTKNIDVDLQTAFNSMANDSRKYIAELTQQINKLGGTSEPDTSISGKIHRAWIDVKATFTGHDRQSILESCAFGDEAAEKAYATALSSDAEMSADVRKLITEQQAAIKVAHTMVEKYRDLHKAVNA